MDETCQLTVSSHSVPEVIDNSYWITKVLSQFPHHKQIPGMDLRDYFVTIQ